MTRRPWHRFLSLTILFCSLLTGTLSLAATRYTFTKIADTSQFPRGFLTDNRAVINQKGIVAFSAFLNPAGEGVFMGTGGAITKIADTTGTLGRLGDLISINDKGTVAFWADLAAGGQGIFTGTGGPITPIVVTDGVFANLYGHWINEKGIVAFYADLVAGGNGTFTIAPSRGSLVTIADASDGFYLFGTPSINAGGTVAFLAGLAATNGVGIFTGTGGALTPIALGHELNSDGFFYLGSPVINKKGTVLFYAGVATGASEVDGIFAGKDGLLTTIVDNNGPFSSFHPRPSINDKDTVAFVAGLKTGGFGIFTGPDPVTDVVIAEGDSLFGSTVTFLKLGRQALNNAGQIAFEASLANGTVGIFRADPVP